MIISSIWMLKGFEASKFTGMIIIDLQKTFDTLNHGITLKRLKYIGFSPKTVKWFKCYLKKQYLIVNIDKSFPGPDTSDTSNCGVPQGFILVPIIFYCVKMIWNQLKTIVTYFLIPSSAENNFIYLSIRQAIKYKIICSGVVSVYSSNTYILFFFFQVS